MSQNISELSLNGSITVNTILPTENNPNINFISTEGISSISILAFANSQVDINLNWSPDGINTDLVETTTVSAGTATTIAKDIKSSYLQLEIILTSSPTVVRIDTIFFLTKKAPFTLTNIGLGAHVYKPDDEIKGLYCSDGSMTIVVYNNEIDLQANWPPLSGVLQTDNTTGGHDIDMTGGSCLKTTSGDMCISINGGASNLNIDGNLVVTGDITSVDYETLSVADSSILLNSGYTTTAGKSAFVVNNYLPTANTALVNGDFVAGVAAVSNPTIVTDNGYAWVVGDIVQTTGCNLEENDALFEVHSYLNPTLTLKGVGLNANTYSFFSSNVTADTVVAGTLTLMTVSALRNSTAGVWQYSNTSTNTTSLTFSSLVTTACWGMMVLTGTTKISPSIGVFYEISGILGFSDVSGFTANANGRLTYTGSPTVRVMVNYSCHDQSLNEPVNEYTIRKNGVVSSFNSITRYEFQSIASVVVTGTFELSTNDYVSVWHDSSKIDNIQTNYYKLQVFTI